MPDMLKPKDRQRSNQSMESFLEAIIDKSDFVVDILIHSKQGNCFYYGVPCSVVTEYNYPNSETSYSFNVWWSKAERRNGIPPKDGFPNYPACAEYKTYFNLMWDQNRYLEFRNVWRDEVVICVFLSDGTVDNTDNMREIAELWEK